MKYLKDYKTFELKTATEKEYYDIIDHIYGDEPELVKNIKQSDNYVSNRKLLKTDSGNLIVKYAEQGNMFIILGIVTKAFKILPSDLAEMYELLDLLITKLKSGMEVLASPNEYSETILKRVMKQLDKENIEYEYEETPSLQLGDAKHLKYKNISLKIN